MRNEILKASSKQWIVFSYGSNSRPQLRARCQNEKLQTWPAYVEDYTRVFSLEAVHWGGGGVASLCPCEGVVTKGSIVRLSDEEKLRLDQFEDGYREIKLNVYERIQGEESVKRHEASVYIAGTSAMNQQLFTPKMNAGPSEAYLTAIHLHLRSHWENSAEEPIDIRSSASPEEALTHWYHPGVDSLKTLEALCVEVNALRKIPWTMPAATQRFTSDLNRILGVYSVQEVSTLLAPADSDTSSLDMLRESSNDDFWDEDAFNALKLLRIHRIFVYGSLMTGLANHHILDGNKARLIRESVQTRDSNFYLISAGNYPFALSSSSSVVLKEKTSALRGQLFAVDTNVLESQLDPLESHPHFYLRSRCDVIQDDEDLGSAWIYLLNDPKTISTIVENPTCFPRVADTPGDWRAYV
eukprot:CAMPEP_0197315708 /NCGR_PEP_ID=MMETSP0891-20130614/39535_1 /TAXON_ID=44058 ORGANISM="Aureoumbra lagunensis, Strain CCMP1510" /NCGR_SAMPLE_ID=MMETSP0891 /ASSEMBLY_ACC=CAM_ASM_000534 /LENGTH=411 /DNA_ID=CAMNT_0042804833 /DNA_START=64 /DNA_END=1296 /DNA_ORIENTATION=-